MNSRSIRVFLVDDHPVISQGLARLLDEEPDLAVCGSATDFATARAGIERENPDVVVVDLALGRESGLDLVAELKESRPAVRTLVLSMYDEHLYAERAIQAGALGYIMKEEAAERIIEAVRRVAEGRIYLSTEMTEIMLQRAARPGGVPGRRSLDQLSNRELETLRLTGSGLSSRQIAEQLHLSVKTVENYKERIKRKLDLHSAQELARYAFEFASNRAP
jgi:DNA-binding NarL/FixJ family response regulator